MLKLTKTEEAVLNLTKQGVPIDEIASRLNINKRTVYNIRSKLKKRGLITDGKKQEGEEKGEDPQSAPVPQPVSPPAQIPQADESSTPPSPAVPVPSYASTPTPPPRETRESTLPHVDVRELLGDYTPVVKKVILNPKILMYYDYVKKKGYEGDLGDFIQDVVEEYFRDRGIRIVVLRGAMEVS